MGGIFPIIESDDNIISIKLLVVGMLSKRKSIFFKATYAMDTGAFIQGNQLFELKKLKIPEISIV